MHTSKYMRISVRCIYQCVAYHLDATHWNYADKKHICERPDERTFTHRFQLKYSSKTTVPAEKKKPDELSNMHHVPLPIQWWSNNSVQTKHAPAKARRTPPHMPLLYHLCMARQTWTVPKISIPLVHGTTFSMCWCVCANKKRTCEQWWAPSHVIHIYRNQRQNTQYSTDVISTAKHSVLNRHWYQQQNTQYSPDVILTATLSTQQTLISTAKHSVLNRRDINGKTLNTQQTLILTAKHSVLNRHWYQRQNTQYSTDVILTGQHSIINRRDINGNTQYSTDTDINGKALSTQQTLIPTAKHSVLNRRVISLSNGRKHTCVRPEQWWAPPRVPLHASRAEPLR